MIRCAIVGALLPHPIIFLAAFAYGVFYGADLFSSSGHSPHGEGLEGGGYAMSNIFILYSLSMGMIPLVVSGLGAIVGIVFCLVRPYLQPKGHPPKSEK